MADAAFVVLELVLFAASRDTLRKYHARAGNPSHRGADAGKLPETNG